MRSILRDKSKPTSRYDLTLVTLARFHPRETVFEQLIAAKKT